MSNSWLSIEVWTFLTKCGWIILYLELHIFSIYDEKNIWFNFNTHTKLIRHILPPLKIFHTIFHTTKFLYQTIFHNSKVISGVQVTRITLYMQPLPLGETELRQRCLSIANIKVLRNVSQICSNVVKKSFEQRFSVRFFLRFSVTWKRTLSAPTRFTISSFNCTKPNSLKEY